MLWKLKRKSLIWLSNALRNWSDAINEYLWNDNVEVSFQAVEQLYALDGATGAAKEQARRNEFLRKYFPSIYPPRK